jgi:Short C-terminal domain
VIEAPGTGSGPEGAEPATPETGGRPQAAPGPISRGRRMFVNSLLVVATVLLVVAIFAVWANRLLFSPDNWSNTSTELLQSQTIRSATANYAADQLYANVDVAGVIKSALPKPLEPLAGPTAGALRNVAVQGVDLALTRPRIQDLWAKANRAADQTFIAIAEGKRGAVSVNQGVVTLDLASLVDNVASRLGLPSNIATKLPPSIAKLTILKSNQLTFVQKGGRAVKGLALLLTILVPIMYALAVLLARGRRRRTLMLVGIGAVVGGIVAILGRHFLNAQITNSLVSEASLRPAVSDVVSIATQMEHQIAAAVIAFGIALIVAAWFAGPARAARTSREAIAPFLREHPLETYGIVLGVMGLIFIWDPIHATGTPAGIIVFTLLALLGTFLLRRQTAEEFAEARKGAATAKLRSLMRGQRQQAKAPPAHNGTTVPEQLGQLADLRDRGALSPDEYQEAKARLLRGTA